MTLTIVEAVVGGSSSKSFFPTEPTESVHAVVKIRVDNRFPKLDGASDNGTTVV